MQVNARDVKKIKTDILEADPTDNRIARLHLTENSLTRTIEEEDIETPRETIAAC